MTRWPAAQVGHIRRRYLRTVKVPAQLAAEIARVTSVGAGDLGRGAARPRISTAFAPTLARVVGAAAGGGGGAGAEGGSLYDALLDDYEPGATRGLPGRHVRPARPRLVALRDRILGAPVPKALSGSFAEDGQLALSRELAAAFGYDRNAWPDRQGGASVLFGLGP